MAVLASRPPRLGGAWRGLVSLGAAVTALAAGAVAAVLAVVFTAALAVVILMGVVLIVLVAAALKGRRPARAADPDVIEAHHMGGRNWIAYGWDQDVRKT